MMQTSTAGKLNNQSQPGFSLFELLVVLVILAIGTGLVIPTFNSGTTTNDINDTVSTLALVMAQGRSHARLTRSNVTINFKQKSIGLSINNKELEWPETVTFDKLVFSTEPVENENELTINGRGIVPATIIRINIAQKPYSLFITPVLREIKYKEGIADFTDFTNKVLM